jgi:hypothetical protein
MMSDFIELFKVTSLLLGIGMALLFLFILLFSGNE